MSVNTSLQEERCAAAETIMSDQPLKLLAVDGEDLAIISAHLQDAVTKVGDLVYLPRERRFAFATNRFDWIASVEGQGEKRRRAAVHFDHVKSVRTKQIDRGQPNQVLCLLAIAFEPTDGPSGYVDMAFCGGACIRLEVECIDACLSDLGPAWPARCRPTHEVGAEPA